MVSQTGDVCTRLTSCVHVLTGQWSGARGITLCLSIITVNLEISHSPLSPLADSPQISQTPQETNSLFVFVTRPLIIVSLLGKQLDLGM